MQFLLAFGVGHVVRACAWQHPASTHSMVSQVEKGNKIKGRAREMRRIVRLGNRLMTRGIPSILFLFFSKAGSVCVTEIFFFHRVLLFFLLPESVLTIARDWGIFLFFCDSPLLIELIYCHQLKNRVQQNIFVLFVKLSLVFLTFGCLSPNRQVRT